MAESPPTEPAGGLPRAQERLAVAALALAAFALNLNVNVLGALLPFVRADLALGDGDAEMLVGAVALGSAAGAIVAGPLGDRCGRRTVLVWGLCAFAAASVAHVPVRSFWLFAVLRFSSGAAVGVAYAAASALVAEVAPYARRGAAMGWFTAGMFLAIPVGLPAAVAFAREGQWPAIFGVQAAAAMLGAWWALRAVPPVAKVAARGLGLGLLQRGPVRAGLFATLLHVGSFFTTVQLATTWLDATGRFPKEDQMQLWVGLGLLSVLGSALLGRVADAVGKRNFVLAASVVLVLCFGLLAREPDGLLLLAIGALLAATAAARTGPLQALLSGLVPTSELGVLMGLRAFAMQLGVFVFALAAAPIGAELGFQGVLMLAASCQLLSYAAIRFGVPQKR